MLRITTAALAASVIALGSTALLAQGTGSGSTGPTSGQTEMKKNDPTGAAAQGEHSQGSGSRALTGTENQPDPNKAVKPDGQPDLKQLDKQGRGGQTN